MKESVRLLSAIAAVAVWGCSQAPANNPSYYAVDGYAAFDSGSAAKADASGDAKDATVAKDTGATDAAAADAKLPDGCSCAGIECGAPEDCPGVDCGACPKGAVCITNTCEVDPNCACAEGECGVLPGCGKDCGACSGGQTCDETQNVCVTDCSCQGAIQCGANFEGCDNADCGACAGGQVCKDGQCIADPKCVCKPGMCGTIAGCPNSCGTCTGGDTCVNNQCTTGGAQCACSGLACGFAKAGCSKSCGTCPLNQYCSANACVAEDAQVLKQFGEPCGPTETCQPPQPGAPQYAQKDYLACLDKQCAAGLFCLQGVCSKKCKIAGDTLNNATGAAGPDGIEDPNVPSGCTGAKNGPAGAQFRCVEQNSPAQVAVGFSDPVCVPGNQFAACKATSDCSGGEVCRIIPILADYQSRCAPKLTNPAGSGGAVPSQLCNDNPVDGPVLVCETGWCTPIGCVATCKTDADCKTAAGACQSGKCTTTGGKCSSDADCPLWKCKAAVKFSGDSLTTFGACQPQP
jgi:hypothetical protein